jgi:hypothetical protein
MITSRRWEGNRIETGNFRATAALVRKPLLRNEPSLYKTIGRNLVALNLFQTGPQEGRRGGLLQGSLMRLVSLWWELPPRLDSNINILRNGMQQFSVGKP